MTALLLVPFVPSKSKHLWTFLHNVRLCLHFNIYPFVLVSHFNSVHLMLQLFHCSEETTSS